MKRRTCLFLLVWIIIFTLAAAAGCGSGTVEEPPGTAADIPVLEEGIPSNTGSDMEDQGQKTDSPGMVQETEGKDPGDPSSEKEPPQEEKPAPLEPPPSAGAVDLRVTRDFGRQTMLQQQAELQQEWTVMQMLQGETQVELAYGGGFVQSINGLRGQGGGLGGDRQDWFYYINGVLADVGGADYYPRPGDIIWWDYHPWDGSTMFSAVIGCYPEPFLHGIRGKVKPTVILCPADYRDLANRLKASLSSRGVVSVEVADLEEKGLKERQGPTVVLGPWKELAELKWLADLNQNYRNGTPVHFSSGEMDLLDYRGKVVKTVEGSAGALTAAARGGGDDSPLWLITGTDETGVEQALELLTGHPEKISGFYGAAVLPGEVIRLPLKTD